MGIVSRNFKIFYNVWKERVQCSAILLSSEIISSFSTNKICSFETILSDRKGFTVFQKVLLSLISFHLNYHHNFSLSFFLWNKNFCTFLHFSYQSEAFNGCYDKLCTMKWFVFCLSITLRVICKWLIKVERWIIMYGS